MCVIISLRNVVPNPTPKSHSVVVLDPLVEVHLLGLKKMRQGRLLCFPFSRIRGCESRGVTLADALAQRFLEIKGVGKQFDLEGSEAVYLDRAVAGVDRRQLAAQMERSVACQAEKPINPVNILCRPRASELCSSKIDFIKRLDIQFLRPPFNICDGGVFSIPKVLIRIEEKNTNN